jgi:hypothetical protein
MAHLRAFMKTAKSYLGLGATIVRQLIFGRRGSVDPELRAMVEASLSMARSELSDKEAVVQLRKAMESNKSVEERAVERLGRRRDTYVGDRAFRLADAAARDVEVQPLAAGRRELFNKERELGSMGLEDAFEWLVRIVPELDGLRRSVREAAPGEWLTPRLHEARELLGPDSHSMDELARTRLASLVAMNYLTVLSGDKRRGDMHTPYFVIAAQPRTIMLVDRRRPKAH